MNTTGLEQSIMVTSALPYPGTSMVSFFRPVGNNLPVLAPAGSSKYMSIREPVPGTPWMLASPLTQAMPSCTRTCSSMTLLVFTLYTRTFVMPSTGSTRPSSMA